MSSYYIFGRYGRRTGQVPRCGAAHYLPQVLSETVTLFELQKDVSSKYATARKWYAW